MSTSPSLLTVALGPLTLSPPVLWAIGLTLGAWFIGLLPLLRNRDTRKSYNEIVGHLLLPFLAAWKLSLLITDFQDVLRRPALLLYSFGGPLNLLVGLIVAFSFLVFFLIRKKSRPLILSLLLFTASLSVGIGAVMLIPRLDGDSDKLSIMSAEERDILVLMDTEGVSQSLADLNDRPLVLNFWATWCPPCRSEMPMLARWSATLDEDIRFFAVNASWSESSPNAAWEWLVEQELEMPLLFDPTGTVNRAFDVASLPTTVVLDAQGRVVARQDGVVSRSWLRSAIRDAKRRGVNP